MAKQFTVKDFFDRFPTDEACLEHLFEVRYGPDAKCPKCGEVGKFNKLAKLPAWTCNCGHHIHPMQGTPFERTHTALQKWFYAMYLFTTSRHGVPAKELQRQLGVTYKTAWRMGHEIRKYMGHVDGDPTLGGHVELDETLVGGRNIGKGWDRRLENKTLVFGIVERDGRSMMRVVKDRTNFVLEPLVHRYVEPRSTISTDEWKGYKRLQHSGYSHGSVNHHRKQWVRGKHHTNTIEGLWAQLKRSIRGTHIHVSAKHLPKYLGEFEYRYNMRHWPQAMFSRLLLAF